MGWGFRAATPAEKRCRILQAEAARTQPVAIEAAVLTGRKLSVTPGSWKDERILSLSAVI